MKLDERVVRRQTSQAKTSKTFEFCGYSLFGSKRLNERLTVYNSACGHTDHSEQ